LRQAFGVGGPQVDTVLSNPNTRPGLGLEGQVNIQGGDHQVQIDYVELALVTKVEVETEDSEYDSTVAFSRLRVTGAFPLAPGQPVSVPFQFPVPWETPITDVFGQHLHGMTMGLRTERVPVQGRRPGARAPARGAPDAAVLPGDRVLPAGPVRQQDQRG
jgi:sporulation-control protein